MQELTIAYFSAAIIFTSGIIYTIQVFKGNIEPNIITWTLFSIIGILVVLTSMSSGAKENLIPLVAMSIPPVLTLIAALFKEFSKNFTRVDVACAVLGVITIIVWYLTKEDKGLAQIGLYLALLADVIAIIPTINSAQKNPQKDRPIPWMIFGMGYLIAFFTIKEHTFANYLPIVWFAFGGMFVWIPLLKYRIKNNISIKNWI